MKRTHSASDSRQRELTSTTNLTFTLLRHIQEEHKPSMIYCVKFCDINTDYYSYFSSVGGNCVSIYHVERSGNVKLIQGYLDEDTEEVFYSCAWCCNSKSSLVLVVSGLRGILKCINCLTFEVDSILVGHGNAVNDLRVHPVNNSLLFSASTDESIRLWNVETGVCVAVFSGEKGHRDVVLCIDPHPLGNCFCSGGMDTSVKIWGLEDPQIKLSIRESFLSPKRPGNLPFDPVVVQFPLFSTMQVHSDYVDSVRWFGNCIVSKSTKNRVALWTPDADRYKGAPLILKEFTILESNLWFVRLDVCVPLDLLGVGNKDGRVFLYPLSDLLNEKVVESKLKQGKGSAGSSSNEDKNDGQNKSKSNEISETYDTQQPVTFSTVLQHSKCRSTVRQVAFHPLGNYVIYSCDDGSISLWDIRSDL